MSQSLKELDPNQRIAYDRNSLQSGMGFSENSSILLSQPVRLPIVAFSSRDTDNEQALLLRGYPSVNIVSDW